MIVVTLVCCYAACWGPTTKHGPTGVARHIGTARDDTITSIAPLLVATQVLSIRAGQVSMERNYYFWFFGYVAKLPYERDLK